MGTTIWNAITGAFTGLGEGIQKGLGVMPQSGKGEEAKISGVAQQTGALQQQTQQPIGAGMFQPMIDGLVKLAGTLVITQKAFSGFSTSIATYAASMTANLGGFFTKMAQAFPLLDTLVKTISIMVCFLYLISNIRIFND